MKKLWHYMIAACTALSFNIASASENNTAAASATRPCHEAQTVTECYSAAFDSNCGWVNKQCIIDPCAEQKPFMHSQVKTCSNGCVYNKKWEMCITPFINEDIHNKQPLSFKESCQNSKSGTISGKVYTTKTGSDCTNSLGCQLNNANLCEFDCSLYTKEVCNSKKRPIKELRSGIIGVEEVNCSWVNDTHGCK